MVNAQFVMFLLREEWPDQFEEISKYGTKITYKTLRTKLSEGAREDLSFTVKELSSRYSESFVEKCDCYVINHPNFPDRKAYGVTYKDRAWIFA